MRLDRSLDRRYQEKAVQCINTIGFNPAEKPVHQWGWEDYKRAARLRSEALER